MGVGVVARYPQSPFLTYTTLITLRMLNKSKLLTLFTNPKTFFLTEGRKLKLVTRWRQTKQVRQVESKDTRLTCPNPREPALRWDWVAWLRFAWYSMVDSRKYDSRRNGGQTFTWAESQIVHWTTTKKLSKTQFEGNKTDQPPCVQFPSRNDDYRTDYISRCRLRCR